MLKTIKEYISNLPMVSFERFYINYIMQIQDENIEREMQYLSNKNLLDVKRMENSIVKEVERLGNEIFY